MRTNILPIVPLRGKVAFPNTSVSFEVGREKTLRAIERASANEDRTLFICTQKVTEKDEINAVMASINGDTEANTLICGTTKARYYHTIKYSIWYSQTAAAVRRSI